MTDKLVNPGQSVFLLAGEVALSTAGSWRVIATDHFPDGATLRVDASSDGSLRGVVAAGFIPAGRYREDELATHLSEIARIEQWGPGGAGGNGYGSSYGPVRGVAPGVGGPFGQASVLGFGHVFGSGGGVAVAASVSQPKQGA